MCDFLFLVSIPLIEKEFAAKGSKFFPFRVDSFQKGTESI